MPAQAQLHIIAISNRKGGTGKTTVAVNLAAELAMLGRRVLLIDLDSQGHCAVGLGTKVDRGDATVHRLFIDPDARLAEVIRANRRLICICHIAGLGCGQAS